MKKHLRKIIIALAFILTTGYGIFSGYAMPVDNDNSKPAETGERIDIPKDYYVTDSVEILFNQDNYVHKDSTKIFGTLEEVVYDEDELLSYVIAAEDNSEHVVLHSDLDLISGELLQNEGQDADEVVLAFRTGQKITLKEGEKVTLYQTPQDEWTFDERAHIKADEMEFYGVVEDFMFIPSIDQKGDIYLSHIVVRSEDDEVAELYFHNLGAESITSEGSMKIEYTGRIFDIMVFETNESDEFSLKVLLDNEEYIIQKGQEIKLSQNENNGFWELKKEIDFTSYKAEVTGFVFGHTGENVTSVDYINLEVDGESVQLAMMQTGAEYAVPHGNYKKIYAYDGHDKVLKSVEAVDGWRMELFYDGDTMLEISVGAEIWIYKNEYDVWVVDYNVEPQDEDTQTA